MSQSGQPRRLPARSPQLTDSARAVLRTLADSGLMTRPQLSELLALSKPTTSAAIAELGALDLVTAQGTTRGGTGRTAVRYGFGPQSGHVIGIDAGTTRVRATAISLNGHSLGEAELTVGRTSERLAAVVRATSSMVRRAASRGPLRAVALALPVIVSATRASFGGATDALLRSLQTRFSAPLLIENNVNCAALAELHDGAAVGSDDFVYLQVGLRIGLGIVSQRRLFRGFHGAAGEVGRLPFPWSPSEVPRHEGLEHYLGSEALLERTRAAWPAPDGAPPATAEELFARARDGSAAAVAAVRRHAEDIGRLVSACVGILDPGLVVLGGGVGQNPLIVEHVRRAVEQLAWPTEIAVTRLGPWATVRGAARLAAAHALSELLDQPSDAAVIFPAGGERAA